MSRRAGKNRQSSTTVQAIAKKSGWQDDAEATLNPITTLKFGLISQSIDGERLLF